MLGTIPSCALFGIDAYPVTVEVDVSGGKLPGYHVVGLPTTSVREGAVRIRSSLEHVGRALPRKKITVNLAPADRRKEGASFDLPIAVAILLGDGLAPIGGLDGLLMLGELGLDGALRPVRGALAAALLARERGMRGVLLPAESAAEAAEVAGIEVHAAAHLSQVLDAMEGRAPLARVGPTSDGGAPPLASSTDMSDVRGQEVARMAIEVAVAGGHNLLMVGAPGIGKTMLARRIPTILPELAHDEALETTKVYSSVGLGRGGLVRERPFRAPHHTITTAALVGGGSPPRAGEASLAHNGVLFLDELPEFGRGTIESLRQPLEDRVITIGRATGHVRLPASFLLAASANPCPCGWLGSEQRACTCGSGHIERYRSRLSGPLLDRIDLQVFVPHVSLRELRQGEAGESSQQIRERVVLARERQRRRLADFGARTNAEMSPRAMRATCRLSDRAESELERLCRVRVALSGRGVDRLVKVARTIADLEGADMVDSDHLLEASSYRALDSLTPMHAALARQVRGSGAAPASPCREVQ
ncbi:MAG TPA: YifB family Mg chelatase-like AAA ATPase [Kofleriaceae bacterium]|nr:YifB family Mg chelatase-like AAA ATPase [Kofleriaceae bacterium]